jgi:hypothetical protein
MGKAEQTGAKAPTDSAPSFMRNGPWIRVQSEIHQGAELRVGLIKQLEAHFTARVYTFFTSFVDQNAQITDEDAEMLESILAVEHDKGKLLLVLSSPGGQALAAERIVNVCRSYSEGDFEVLVPHMAKSAATMICFGASAIHMSPTAELGPVDPQVPYKDDQGQWRWISAQEYIRSYDKLMTEARGGKHQRIEPYIQQLNRYDSRFVEGLISVQSLAENISVRLLKTGMMKGKSDAAIKKSIDVFLTQAVTSSHGRMINIGEARQCGLSMKNIDLHSPIWNAVWELYVRSDAALGFHGNRRKLIESARSAVEVSR